MAQRLGVVICSTALNVLMFHQDNVCCYVMSPGKNLKLEGIHQGIREALSGQTIPLSQMWDGIDAE